MAKKQIQIAGAQGAETAALDPAHLVQVRVLSDHAPLGLVAGRVATVPRQLLAELKARAMVDDEPAAVEYARAQCAADGD